MAIKSSLTFDDLRAALDALPPPLPKWATMIEDADSVEIKTSEYLPDDGRAYVLDPTVDLMGPWPTTAPLLVVCRPEDEAKMRHVVERLRAERRAG